jgi:hypothetical protein
MHTHRYLASVSFAAASLLITVACQRGDASRTAPPPAVESEPPAPTLSASTSASGPTRDDLSSCKAFADHRYSVVIRGDGEPVEYREGGKARALGPPMRYCAPAANSMKAHGSYTFGLFACASRADTARSCVSIEDDVGEYIDREGSVWQLQAKQPIGAASGPVHEGTVQATARRGAQTKELTIAFRAGTRVWAVPAGASP